MMKHNMVQVKVTYGLGSCVLEEYTGCVFRRPSEDGVPIKVFYSPTDAQVNFLKNNFKMYIKIYIKTTLTCFVAVTPSTGSAFLVLAKVTVVKIAN